jgi:hypothetical protein
MGEKHSCIQPDAGILPIALACKRDHVQPPARQGVLAERRDERALQMSPPNRDRLTMRVNPLRTLDLILSLSKEEGRFHGFSAACQHLPENCDAAHGSTSSP